MIFRKGIFYMKKFFSSLSHSAKVTVITCGCFVMLTMLILIFLMLCPIHETSSANNANRMLVVTTTTTAGTTQTTAATTGFTRKTTDANRVTTTTTTIDDDSYDTDYDNTPSYQYRQTTTAYQYHYVTTTKRTYVYTTAAATTAVPVITESPTPAATLAPQQQETIPATIPSPDDNNAGVDE